MNGKNVNRLIAYLNQIWTPKKLAYGVTDTIEENEGKSGHSTYMSLGTAGGINSGLEVVTPHHRYHFEGMRSKAKARAPVGIFHYTLEGWGILDADHAENQVRVEHAMTVKVPSLHCFRSSPDCERWSFFWMVFDHPYLIERLFSNPDMLNKVISLPADSAPVRMAVNTLKLVWTQSGDAPAVELSLYRWMLEMERWIFSQKHLEQPRQTLLDEVRKITLENLERAPQVEWIAEKFGMSRTHFTHYFKRTTGLQPATFIREVRLHCAASLLREQNLSVKEVAARTGFSDANHLCKTFRTQFHLSPGAYRQLRTQNSLPRVSDL